MATDQHPDLEWRGPVPVATRFDDPYFSLENGLEETRHVFLAGNRLEERFRSGFQIAELGFGTGLNCLAALELWLRLGCEGVLRYTSFELFPMAADDMAQSLAHFPEVAHLAGPMVEAIGGGASVFENEHLRLEVVRGDARETVPAWSAKADAWFLDGFSPAKNPELWEPDLMRTVALHTAAGGTVATYSAAGAVRAALAEAGFQVERVKGFGRKRHMTMGALV